MTDHPVELRIDLNSEDETGLPWTFLDHAVDSDRVQVGRYLVAGAGEVAAVVEVIDVGADGLVHVRPVHGDIEQNLHLLDRAPSAS